MMKASLLLLAALLVPGFQAIAQPALPSADQVMAQTKASAAAEHKNILLIFSASWCGPCRMFEAFLKDPETGPIMGRHFVAARLDVGERPGDTRHADSPGAEALRASLKGAEAGYPYLVMLNAAGRPIVNSFCPSGCSPPGENIGYPATRGGIDWFMRMLEQGAPNLTPSEAGTIRSWLQKRGRD